MAILDHAGDCLRVVNAAPHDEAGVAARLVEQHLAHFVVAHIDNTAYGYNESGKINMYLINSMYALLASLPTSIVNKNTLSYAQH